ncbi:type II restriction endonuclease [Microbulbifer sp. SA54]|uniref:type II restriction endonuclease n=1 Tax=Microbulbifer sp. SA54 TaxID=3401577 RepID=UPI003AAE4F7A
MSVSKLQEWIGEKQGSSWHAYVKRLSANDTGLTGGHGAGIYIPHEFSRLAFPSIFTNDEANPSVICQGQVQSHDLPSQYLRVIYYNSKRSENKRNGRDEQRITRWKQGVEYAPLQDPDNTGALTIVAFEKNVAGFDTDYLHIWMCDNTEEEDYLEGLIGEVLPTVTVFQPFTTLIGGTHFVHPGPSEELSLPEEWGVNFPTGKQISDYVATAYPYSGISPDKRLLKRYEDEYRVFRTVESCHVMPLIGNGFQSVSSFISLANSVGNRRKSRAGRSLELHLERIFIEEGLTRFATQVKTEGNKRPDFLFPDGESYYDGNFPDSRLNMLAVKTTLKDRWRQVINEADRIRVKYLFTLQEGISENQFRELSAAGIRLVVPKSIRKRFPPGPRSEILSLGEFICKMKSLQVDQPARNSSPCR